MNVKLDVRVLDLILTLSTTFNVVDRKNELITFKPDEVLFNNAKLDVRINWVSGLSCTVRKDVLIKFLSKHRGKDLTLTLSEKEKVSSLTVQIGQSCYDFFLHHDLESHWEVPSLDQESFLITSELWGNLQSFLKMYEVFSIYIVEGGLSLVAVDDSSLFIYLPKEVDLSLVQEFTPIPLLSKQALVIDKLLTYNEKVKLSYDTSRLLIQSELTSVITPLSYKFPLMDDYAGYLDEFIPQVQGEVTDLYAAIKDVEVMLSTHDNLIELSTDDQGLVLRGYSPDIGKIESRILTQDLTSSFKLELNVGILSSKLRYLLSSYKTYELQVDNERVTFRFNEIAWLILPSINRLTQ